MNILPSDKIFDKARNLLARGEKIVLATVVRSESHTAAKAGAKAFIDKEGNIYGWIGGGCAQPAVMQTAEQVMSDGQPQLIRVGPKSERSNVVDLKYFSSGCYSGGTLDIFLEPIETRPEVIILGVSPVAQSLAQILPLSGFSVSVAAPEIEKELFDGVAQILDGFDLSRLDCRNPKSVIVATQGKGDMAGLEAALATQVGHIPFVASAKKAAKIKENLQKKEYGISDLDRIVSPCGLSISAETPVEIAVSIVAELIQLHRNGFSDADSEPAENKSQSSVSCCGAKQTGEA